MARPKGKMKLWRRKGDNTLRGTSWSTKGHISGAPLMLALFLRAKLLTPSLQTSA